MPELVLRDHTTLHYETLGQGEDVVMIHGLGANLAFWYMGIARQLARRYRVIVYDLRGHGRSGMPAYGYTLLHMTEDLHALLYAVGVERVHLVGHSFGARVALAYAISHPERLASLTIADTILRALQPEVRLRDWPYWEIWKQQLREQGYDSLPADDEIISFRLLAHFNQLSPGLAMSGATQRRRPSLRHRDMGRRGGERWQRLMSTAAAHELEDDRLITRAGIQRIQAPTLAIYGEYSHCLETCWQLQRLMPRCDVVIVPRAGHFHPAIRPGAFTAVLSRFLRRHRYLPRTESQGSL